MTTGTKPGYSCAESTTITLKGEGVAAPLPLNGEAPKSSTSIREYIATIPEDYRAGLTTFLTNLTSEWRSVIKGALDLPPEISLPRPSFPETKGSRNATFWYAKFYIRPEVAVLEKLSNLKCFYIKPSREPYTEGCWEGVFQSLPHKSTRYDVNIPALVLYKNTEIRKLYEVNATEWRAYLATLPGITLEYPRNITPAPIVPIVREIPKMPMLPDGQLALGVPRLFDLTPNTQWVRKPEYVAPPIVIDVVSEHKTLVVLKARQVELYNQRRALSIVAAKLYMAGDDDEPNSEIAAHNDTINMSIQQVQIDKLTDEIMTVQGLIAKCNTNIGMATRHLPIHKTTRRRLTIIHTEPPPD